MENKEYIKKIIEETKDGLVWSLSSNVKEVKAYSNGILYTLTYLKDNTFALLSFDENGGIDKDIEPDSYDTAENLLLYELFILIKDHNSEIQEHFENSETKKNNLIVSYSKVLNRLADVGSDLYGLEVKQSDSFRVHHDSMPTFIEPTMKQIGTSKGFTPYDSANVLLISAPGATGKTWLTNNLSLKKQVPIYDIANDQVGSNSLVGMLFKGINTERLSDFIVGLKNGTASIIVDALDEGYVRVTHKSFESFLDDIINLSKDSTGLPFVLMGRPSIMDFTSLYLEENNVNVTYLQIVPFLRDKAYEFINRRRFGLPYIKDEIPYYKDLIDYILNTIEGFFSNTSEINKLQFSRFIGYAPVLMAITSMVSRNQDYHKQLQELQVNNTKNLDLLVDIVRMLLDREREKIKTAITEISDNRPDKEEILRKAYSPIEQCKRVFDRVTGNVFTTNIVDGDETFNSKYEETVKSFFEEHPFLENGSFQNLVFESYIIATLISDNDYSPKVLQYLRSIESQKGAASYLLFGIYFILKDENDMDKEFLPYLIASFQSLDSSKSRSCIEIVSEGSKGIEDTNLCAVFFTRNPEEEYTLAFKINPNEKIHLGSLISNVTIDVPCTVSINRKKVDIVADVSINCKKLEITSDELVINTSSNAYNILLAADIINCNTESGNIPVIKNTGGVSMKLMCTNRLFYPYIDYCMKLPASAVDDKKILALFQKLRRTMLLFRPSHGELTVSKSKIDSRIVKTEEGRMVVNALVKDGVIVLKNGCYTIDYDREADILGAKYDDLRNCLILPKIEDFLSRAMSEDKKNYPKNTL